MKYYQKLFLALYMYKVVVTLFPQGIDFLYTCWKWSRWSFCHGKVASSCFTTQWIFTICIITVMWDGSDLKITIHSHKKNKRHDLGSNDDFLPYSLRFQYILKDTGYCTIPIIDHNILLWNWTIYILEEFTM